MLYMGRVRMGQDLEPVKTGKDTSQGNKRT